MTPYKNGQIVYTVVGNLKGMVLAVIYGMQGIAYYVRLEDGTTGEFFPQELTDAKQLDL